MHLNFGKVEGMPLPELRFKLPQAVANIERAQFWAQVLQIPGMAVVKSEVYDSLGIAMPGKGDEVLEAPSHEQDAQGGLEAMLQGVGKGDSRKRDEVAVAARAKQSTDGLTRALPAWLEPIKKNLIEARKSGATLAELREQMLEWHPNTQALADAFAENVEAGLRGEVADEVRAATGKTNSDETKHVKGCNQYEDKPGCAQFSNKKKNKPKKSNKVGKIDKKAIFDVGSFPWLQDLGIKDGFVSVDGNIVREGITRGRWTANNATRKINESLKNHKLSRQGLNHKKKNKAVVETFCVLKTDEKTYYNKIVIDKQSGKVVSFHDIGKNKFMKETEKASSAGKR